MTCLVACYEVQNTIKIDQHEFRVDYAVSAEDRMHGLMFVEKMPEDYGMIFVNPHPQVTKFWMKNTLIPLDMLFFDNENKLIHIEHKAQPHDLTGRGPNSPVCRVVELNGGVAEKLGIEVGAILIEKDAQECLQLPNE